MYGMVNQAVEELICTQFGEETWEKIKREANVEVDVFLSNESYPDDVTYSLVTAASKVLEVRAEKVLELFGEYWILHTAQKGYGALIKSAGTSLSQFLINLPVFHDRIVLMYPRLRPPEFKLSQVGESSLHLHYHTHRPGLSWFVIGLLQGLGKLYGTPARAKSLGVKRENGWDEEFLVEWDQPLGVTT